MPTEPDLGVDLSLVTEDHNEVPCVECVAAGDGINAVATWEMLTATSCNCLPNPMPLCEVHKISVDAYIAVYTQFDWVCHNCGSTTDVLEVRRRRA